jgi:hypothetical protein
MAVINYTVSVGITVSIFADKHTSKLRVVSSLSSMF